MMPRSNRTPGFCGDSSDSGNQARKPLAVFWQRFHHQLPSGVRFGDTTIIGYVKQYGDLLLAAISVNAVITDPYPVNNYPEGNSCLSHHVNGKLQIMQSERCRFCDEQDEVRAANGSYHRAGGSGWCVKYGYVAVLSVLRARFHGANERGSHGHTDIKPALDQRDLSRLYRFDNSYTIVHLADSPFGADSHAPAAAVAHLGKDQWSGRYHSDGVILAKRAALAATITQGAVNARHRDADNARFPDRTLDKQMTVWFLDIAIK